MLDFEWYKSLSRFNIFTCRGYIQLPSQVWNKSIRDFLPKKSFRELFHERGKLFFFILPHQPLGAGRFSPGKRYRQSMTHAYNFLWMFFKFSVMSIRYITSKHLKDVPFLIRSAGSCKIPLIGSSVVYHLGPFTCKENRALFLIGTGLL